jgi:hypothetical protein
MELLTRQALIAHLQAAADGTTEARALSEWAFDRFYSEEAGTVEFEPGYRRAIGAVLDDLMFGDQPGFVLSAAELQQMIQHLLSAQPIADDLDDEEDDEDEDLE